YQHIELAERVDRDRNHPLAGLRVGHVALGWHGPADLYFGSRSASSLSSARAPRDVPAHRARRGNGGSKLGKTATYQTRRPAAGRTRMAPRTQIRRLPDACPAGPRRGPAADPHRPPTGRVNTRRSPRRSPNSLRVRPILTANCAASGPMAPP